MVWEGYLFSPPLPSGATTTADSGSTWPLAISSVAWSEYRPAVFFVLDSAGSLFSFDVLRDDTGPVGFEASPLTTNAVVDGRGSEERIVNGQQGQDNGHHTGEEKQSSWKSGGERNPRFARSVRSHWTAPMLAMSMDTLTTGCSPRVAISVKGKTFTRGLSRRFFRTGNSSAAGGGAERESAEAKTRDGGFGGVQDGRNSGRGNVVEKEMMEEWLRTVLWAG